MSFLSLFGGDSKSSTSNADNKVGASDNAIANRSDNNAGTIIIGSDAVANNAVNQVVSASHAALDVAHQSLADTEGFLTQQLNNLFQNLNQQAASVQANITTAQQTAADVVKVTQQQASDAISKSQQTAVDDFIKVIFIMGGIGVALYAIKSGVFK